MSTKAKFALSSFFRTFQKSALACMIFISISGTLTACTAPSQSDLTALAGNPTSGSGTTTTSTPAPTATPATNSLVLVGGDAQTVGVGVTASSNLVVKAKTSANVAIAASPVTFTVSGPGTVDSNLVSTDVNGLASVTFTAGNSSGTAVVTATSAEGTVTFTIAVVPLTAFSMQYVAGDAQTGNIGANLTAVPLKVLVLDSGGVPAQNVIVNFATTAGNGKFSGANSTLAITNSSGYASATFTLGTTGGTNTVKASLLSAATVYVTFTETGTVPSNSTVDLAQSTVSLSANTSQANGSTQITVTVRVKDEYGNLIPNSGQTIATTFAPATGAWVTSSAFTYASTGTYQNIYQVGNTTATVVFSATINAAALTSGTASLAVTAGSTTGAGGATLTAISGGGQSVQIGQTAASNLKVLALDSLGNPVVGSTVTFTVSGGTGSGTLGSGFSSKAATTGSDGTAEVTFEAVTAGTVTVTASSIQGSAGFSLTVQDLTGYTVNIVNPGTTNNQSASINAALSTNMKVQVLNASNQPVASTQVRFQCQSANCGLFSNGTNAITGTTDASGYLEEAYTLGTATGTYTVRVILPQQATIYTDFTHTGTVSASATVSAAQTLVSLSSSTLQANGTSQTVLTVTIKDQYGNTIPTCGKTVTASFSPTTGSWGAAFACAGSSGVYTRTYTVGTSGTSEVATAVVNGVTMTNTATLTLTPNSYDLSVSATTRSVAILTANNTDTSLLTFSLKDAYGNLVYDASNTVQFVATPNTLGTLVGSVTNVGNGTYTQVYKAGTVSNAGSVSLQAQFKAGGVGSWVNAGSAVTIAFQPGAVSLSNSTFTSTKLAVAPSGTVTLTVAAKDAYSNPITSGLTVAITQATGTGTLGSLTNNGDGTYTKSYTAPGSTGSSTFNATIGGSAVGSTITLTIVNLAGTSITCANYTTACNGGTCANADLYVESGTLTITNRTNNTTSTPDCTMTFNSVTVASGGYITHTTSTSTNAYGMEFNVTGALTVNSGGYIQADAKGYIGGTPTTAGYTNGNTATGGAMGASASPGWTAAAASYGGYGSRGAFSSNHPLAMNPTKTTNALYGSAANPVHPGSGGGGSHNTLSGGSGGGVIRITAGNIVNNGVISATGGNATADPTYGICGGAGSGGSIYLSLSGGGTLTGSGSIKANGGTSQGINCIYNTVTQFADGGGGRVAIVGDDTSWPLSQIQVKQGNPGVRGSTGGTIYRSLGAYTTSQTLSTDLFVNDESDTTNIFGSSSTITIPSGSVLTLAKAITVGSLTVQSGGYVSAPFSATSGAINGINITATGTITVNSGGYIFADYRGYAPGYTNGNTTTGAASATTSSAGGATMNHAGGGSYGGRGQNPRISNAVYGSASDVVYPGAGGAVATSGGAGGGLIILTAADVVNNGIITANGADVQTYLAVLNSGINAGGGSGGGIKITVSGGLTGAGTIRANGGLGDASSNYVSGHGGGGRIYISESTSNFPLAQMQVNSGGWFSWAGSYGGGTPGTIYRTKGAYSGSQTLNGDLWVEADGSGNATGTNVLSSATDLTVAANKVLMADGALTLNSLTVNGIVTHSHPFVSTLTPKVNLTITNTLNVGSGGSVDATGRGFPGTNRFTLSSSLSNVSYVSNWVAMGQGLASCANANVDHGGSHYTAGGCKHASLSTWGSLTDPNTYGGAGRVDAGNYHDNSGGGIIRLTAGTMQIDGNIKANAGADGYNIYGNGAAGGSIKLSAPAMTISGTATVSANGSSPEVGSVSAGGQCSGAGGIIYIKRTIASSTISITPSNVKGTTSTARCSSAPADGPAVTYDTYP